MSFDWTAYIPTDADVQESQRTETEACVAFSAVHIIETIHKQQTGIEIRYSERALAKLSGTTPQGNSFANVVAAINKYGLILENDWPIPTDNYSWDEFYADIPPEVLLKAIKCPVTMNWSLGATPLAFLEKAPLWLEIRLSPTVTHACELVNPTTYFDSYGKLLKPLDKKVLHYYQLTINNMNQAKVVKSKSSPTVFICYPIPDEDYLAKKATLEGFDVPNPIPDTDSLK